MALRSSHRTKLIRNPIFIHHLSSSSDSHSKSPSSSYFSDVKASLNQQQPPCQRQQGQPGGKFSTPPTQGASLDQIDKSIDEFLHRSAAPSPVESPSPSDKTVSFQVAENQLAKKLMKEVARLDTELGNPELYSFRCLETPLIENDLTIKQELYKRNVASKVGGSGDETNEGGKLSFTAIRESLLQLKANTPKTKDDPLSLKKFIEASKEGGSGNKTNEGGKLSFTAIRESLLQLETNTPKTKEDPLSLRKFIEASKEVGSGKETNDAGKLSFNSIRESLLQLKGNILKTNADPLSLKKFNESFTLHPTVSRDPPFVIGSPEKLPESVFSKELKEKKEGDTSPAMKTEFVKMYSFQELGENLRKLRAEGKLGGGLLKSREMVEKETALKIGDVTGRDLRESLIKLQISEKNKNTVTFEKKLRKLTAEGKLGSGLMKSREMVEKETALKIGDVTGRDLRESLIKLQISEKNKNNVDPDERHP